MCFTFFLPSACLKAGLMGGSNEAGLAYHYIMADNFMYNAGRKINIACGEWDLDESRSLICALNETQDECWNKLDGRKQPLI
jgi:hypothetical protein